jgi:hypothetical protein
MISHIHFASAFQGPQVRYIFNNNDRRIVTTLIRAQFARVGRIYVSACVTHAHRFNGICQCPRKGFHQSFFLFDQVQGSSPCRARPKTRQPGKQLDETFNLLTAIRMGH